MLFLYILEIDVHTSKCREISAKYSNKYYINTVNEELKVPLHCAESSFVILLKYVISWFKLLCFDPELL